MNATNMKIRHVISEQALMFYQRQMMNAERRVERLKRILANAQRDLRVMRSAYDAERREFNQTMYDGDGRD